MKYNVGDMVIYKDGEDGKETVRICGRRDPRPGFQYVGDDWGSLFLVPETSLAPLTEGQDEQNELWEEVVKTIVNILFDGTNEDANIHDVILKLKQSFTIKRK